MTERISKAVTQEELNSYKALMANYYVNIIENMRIIENHQEIVEEFKNTVVKAIHTKGHEFE